MRPLPQALVAALCLSLTPVIPACRGRGKSKSKDHLSPRKARDLSTGADKCSAQGDYACAMERLSKVVKSRPADAKLLNRFALAARLRYYQTGEMDFRDQELEALRKAVKLLPSAANIQVNFGTTAWELGMRKEAAKAYQRALELTPKHPDAALMAARIKRSTVEVEDEEDQ